MIIAFFKFISSDILPPYSPSLLDDETIILQPSRHLSENILQCIFESMLVSQSDVIFFCQAIHDSVSLCPIQ